MFKMKDIKYLIAFLTFSLSICLTSCIDNEDEDINNPKTIENVIGIWKGKLSGHYCMFEFKEDMTVIIYSDSEGMDWAIGFPWEYKWKTVDNRVELFDGVKENSGTMRGILKDNNNIIEIYIFGSENTILHRTSTEGK